MPNSCHSSFISRAASCLPNIMKRLKGRLTKGTLRVMDIAESLHSESEDLTKTSEACRVRKPIPTRKIRRK